ncbi:MAG: ribonuclease H-like domain-containing protein [Candidatus Woesearchaeota archaeon]
MHTIGKQQEKLEKRDTMLTSTFIHIDGIGKKTEQSIWGSDVYTWKEFLEKNDRVKLGTRKKEMVISSIQESLNRIQQEDYGYFYGLPHSEHWRVYKELKDKCCFLDIETTGLDKQGDDITLIGIYDGKEPKIFIKGQNLEDFKDEVKKYPLVITFNGRCFDIPFIKEHFPEIKLEQFHIDLRFVLASLGFRGGLKSVESQLGLQREDSIKGMDGFESVVLWHKYQRGNKDALVKLTEYLRADICNLKPLMEYAYEEMKNRHFYGVAT